MPIYEYICSACGHEEEFIQKINDKPLTKCPKCGKQKFTKQISSTAFQLKGEGWYVTDFRDKNKKKTDAGTTPAAETKSAVADAKPAETKSPETRSPETKSTEKSSKEK